MIAYLPEIYEEELVYSWFGRYYAHMYPVYACALEDLLGKKNIRPDMEFINRLCEDARRVITKTVSMEELILNHTMLPYFRFAENTRLRNALGTMSEGIAGDCHRLLPVTKNRTAAQKRYMRYCPICAAEARKKYGEAYWTRSAVMRNISICVKHGCRLKVTKLEISGKQSGRLYVAEEEIADTVPEMVGDGLELKFMRYMMDVFYKPINYENSVSVGDFLKSRLEGTKYLSVRGKRKNISLLFDDLTEFFRELHMEGDGIVYAGISEVHQIQHILSGKCFDFYLICQLAYFLGISPNELTNPALPAETQTKLYNAKVERLYVQGLGCYRIAREVGGCPSTVRHANQTRERKPHDYAAARLGKQKRDWEQYDTDMLPEVRKAAEQIYNGDGGRPKRVTVFAVAKLLGFPNMRMEYYMPKCKELVGSYYEEYPVYWAREVVWCYNRLQQEKNEDDIIWRNIRDMTNLRKENFLESFPYLNLFTDEETADRIKSLV